MLRSRIIPCLLVHNRGLVKTVEFKNAKYVGDPINAVKIFNEKEVDEIIVLDIDASAERRGPDFTLIKNVATECRMPLCYGGGISSVEHARQIIKLGVEKIAINYAAINNFSLIRDIGEVVGLQSVVVCIDVRRRDEGGYDIEINFNQSLRDFVATIVHEMVHVKQYATGKWKGTGEREASNLQYKLTDKLWKENIL